MGLPWCAIPRGWKGGGDAVWLWGAAGWLRLALHVPPAGRSLGLVSSTVARALMASYTVAPQEQVVLVLSLSLSPALSVCSSVTLSVSSSVSFCFSLLVPVPVSTSLPASLSPSVPFFVPRPLRVFICGSLSLSFPVCALVSVYWPDSCPCLNLGLQLACSVSAFPAPSHVPSFREHSCCYVAWRCSLSIAASLTN